MNAQHVFLSYIREDADHMNELEKALESAGFTVWRDTNDLWPGENWELKIREAIRSGSLVFLACFSSALDTRKVSYQYKELMIAAEEYKVRPLDTSWLMTVRFDECVIPSVDLGGGRYLDETIHRTDLFGKNHMSNLTRLTSAIHRIVDSMPATAAPSIGAAVSAAKGVDSDQGLAMDRLRELLRHPEFTMDFDDYLVELRGPILGALRDREKFPTKVAGGRITEHVARDWVTRLRSYDDLLAPVLPQLRLIGMYGSDRHHNAITKTVTAIAQESYQETGTDLLRHLHHYPAVLLTYALALGASIKENYSAMRATTVDVAVRGINGKRRPFISVAGPRTVVDNWPWLGTLLAKTLEDGGFDQDYFEKAHTGRIGARYTPISDHLFATLSPVFANDFTDDEDYADRFDSVEVMLDALNEHDTATTHAWGGRTVYGRHTWRHRYADTPPELVLKEQLERVGLGWTPLLAGMFGGDVDAAKVALDTVHETATTLRSQRF